LIFTVNQQL